MTGKQKSRINFSNKYNERAVLKKLKSFKKLQSKYDIIIAYLFPVLFFYWNLSGSMVNTIFI